MTEIHTINGMTCRLYTAKEMAELPSPSPEWRYRNGYKDGYVAALMDVYDKRGVPDKHWNFWIDDLHAWLHRAYGEDGRGNGFELPPQSKRSK